MASNWTIILADDKLHEARKAYMRVYMRRRYVEVIKKQRAKARDLKKHKRIDYRFCKMEDDGLE